MVECTIISHAGLRDPLIHIRNKLSLMMKMVLFYEAKG